MSVRKRGKHWHYQFMVAGQRYYGVLDTAQNKSEAKVLEAEEVRKVRLGDRSKPGLERFETFVNDVYLKYSKENKVSWKHDVSRCKMLCEHFGEKRFNEITVLQIVKFIKDRLSSKVKRYRQLSEPTRTRSAVTVSKEVTLLSGIFRMAIRERVATQNPVAAIPKLVRKQLPARRRRRCPLDDEKEQRLIQRGLHGRRAHLRPVVIFDLHTGLRLGELRRLESSHVNLEPDSKWFDIDGESWEVPQDCFIITRSKNGKPRVIPLNARARAIAVHQIADVTIEQYLFPQQQDRRHDEGSEKGI